MKLKIEAEIDCDIAKAGIWSAVIHEWIATLPRRHHGIRLLSCDVTIEYERQVVIETQKSRWNGEEWLNE